MMATCYSFKSISPGLLGTRPYCVSRKTVAGQAGRIFKTATMKTCKCGCGLPVTKGCSFVNKHQNRGSNHPNYKGGERIFKGYVFVLSPNHPRKNKRGYVKRAWLVMEQKMGRYIQPGELVHHDNQNKLDDSEGNLVLTNKRVHGAIHNGGSGNPSARRDIITERDILPLRSKGYSQRKIADLLHCGEATIKRRLRKTR